MLGLCERFGCLPSHLMAEDASLMAMLEYERLGKTNEPEEVDPYGE